MPALAAVCFSVMSTLVGSHASASSAFSDDVAFLSKHVGTVVLGSGGSKVAVVGAYQGRVMTSTDGASGLSYGWINRELIGSGKLNKHINAFGGEDRFWLGPEGGQFSIYFHNGDKFDLDHWQTPAEIDSIAYDLVKKTDSQATFQKSFEVENYMGVKLGVGVTRTIKVLNAAEAAKNLKVAVPAGVHVVGYESQNAIKNTGKNAWTEDKGMLSIWILGMMNASPATTITVPFRKGSKAELGDIVHDTYFGKVPSDRLKIKGDTIYFKGDAKYRSKIGIPPKRAKPVIGSYDGKNHVLTLVQFTFTGKTTKYVNSMWEIQQNPFGGDTVNSYNDGPPKPGAKQLGQFYEIESSSPALGLAPGETGKHTHRTFHLQGDPKALDAIAKATLGVGIKEIENGLK